MIYLILFCKYVKYINISYEVYTLPFGKICVHRLLLDVNLIVTCEGSNGLIKALPGRMIAEARESGGGEPAEPTTARNGDDNSASRFSLVHTRDLFAKIKSYYYHVNKNLHMNIPSLFAECGETTGLPDGLLLCGGIVIACDLADAGLTVSVFV